MTAMLGMYDMPPLQAANDRFWTLIRTHLGQGPESLTRDRDHWEVWQDPGMVFSQTCGMPYRTRLHGRVRLVGTPDYGLTGCPPGHYCSVFVARGDDARALDELVAGTFAYNEALSQSGWAAPLSHLSGLGLRPRDLLQTGGHARSAEAVARGSADLASLDALTWELLKEHTDLGVRLREVARTAPTPTLPYITALARDARAVAAAVRAAIADLSPADRETLHIRQLVDIPSETYLAVPTPPGPETIQAGA
ncbi:phosphate/phosphite/phosphonate ABC transporter substrate-binding protein [Ruegeria sediminis]|uniref:Phosphate/phosphite/phosphonate ABC transporter substrate-binding protein n=1 Tax=Ruegeria sediminis TaxID=2583820 RepID=A0ABY2X2I0_9RHOB|nr:PhnD/SsuA/transferrin family substrate-binding protein [Ruegeria sediminis]TMV09566.1 phosphate/phosphite/phosphonate ABC transporter substrate-binding protein [Ruegeria sediminis]